MSELRKWTGCIVCPICTGIEQKERTAEILQCTPQYDYCSCDKIGERGFWLGGYCEDAAALGHNETFKKTPQRTFQAGRPSEYRRTQETKRDRRRRKISASSNRNYICNFYVQEKYEDGHSKQVGTYVKWVDMSGRKRYYKNAANRAVRRNKGEIPRGNAYRKIYDYAWEID